MNTARYWIALLVVSGVLKKRLSRHLRYRILTGLPELTPERPDNRLLAEGVYSRIRHPRYAQVWIALAGYALIANYAAVCALVASLTLVIGLLVRIEEKELRDRFGAAYEDYCARVPRFLPRF